jgi:uncharacterized membrane protein YraQ (UPF0718 family)
MVMLSSIQYKYFTFSSIGESEMFENLPPVVTFFFHLLAELIPLFLLVTFLVGLSLEFISPETLQRHLSGKRRAQGTILATVLGYITPFCSCSTVPIAAAMIGAGIPLGLVVAFVFASPYPVETGLFVLGPLFGWPFAVAFSVVGMVLAFLMGIIVDNLNWQDQIKPSSSQMLPTGINGANPEEAQGCGCDVENELLDIQCCDDQEIEEDNSTDCGCVSSGEKRSAPRVVKNALLYSFGFLKKLFPYVIFGSLVGSLIYGYMPEEIVLQYAGSSNFIAVPIAALIGVPIYMSSSAIIPIIYSLHLKGMSGGAVTALLITATAISPPEILMLSKMFEKKIMAIFAVSMIIGAVIVGYIFNIISMLV